MPPPSYHKKRIKAASYLYRTKIKPLLILLNKNKREDAHFQKLQQIPSHRIENLLQTFSQMHKKKFSLKTSHNAFRVRMKFMGNVYELYGEDQEKLTQKLLQEAWNDVLFNGGWDERESRLKRLIGHFESLNYPQSLKKRREFSRIPDSDLEEEFDALCIAKEVVPKIVSMFRVKPYRYAVRINSRNLIILGSWNESRVAARLSAIRNAIPYLKSLNPPQRDTVSHQRSRMQQSPRRLIKLGNADGSMDADLTAVSQSLFMTVSQDSSMRESSSGVVDSSESVVGRDTLPKYRIKREDSGEDGRMLKGDSFRDMVTFGNTSTLHTNDTRSTCNNTSSNTSNNTPTQNTNTPPTSNNAPTQNTPTPPPNTPKKFYLYNLTTNTSAPQSNQIAFISERRIQTPLHFNLDPTSQVTITQHSQPITLTKTEYSLVRRFHQNISTALLDLTQYSSHLFPYFIVPVHEPDWEGDPSSHQPINWNMIQMIDDFVKGEEQKRVHLAHYTLSDLPEKELFNVVFCIQERYYSIAPEAMLAGKKIPQYILEELPYRERLGVDDAFSSDTNQPVTVSPKRIKITKKTRFGFNPLGKHTLKSLLSLPLITEKLNQEATVQHFRKEYAVEPLQNKVKDARLNRLLLHSLTLPPSPTFQSMEYIGDAFLELIRNVYEMREFYENDAHHESMKVAHTQAHVISNKHLYESAQKANLHKHLIILENHEHFVQVAFSPQGYSITGKLFADCVESIIGSLLVGSNFDQAFQFVQGLEILKRKQADLLLTPWKLPQDHYEYSHLDSLQDLLRHDFNYPYLLQDALELSGGTFIPVGRCILKLSLIHYFQRHNPSASAQSLDLKVNTALQPEIIGRMLLQSRLFHHFPAHRLNNPRVMEYIFRQDGTMIPPEGIVKIFYSISGALFLDLYTEVSDSYSLSDIFSEWRQCMHPFLYLLVAPQLENEQDPLKAILDKLSQKRSGGGGGGKLRVDEYTAHVCDITIGNKLVASSSGVDVGDARRRALYEAYQRVSRAKYRYWNDKTESV